MEIPGSYSTVVAQPDTSSTFCQPVICSLYSPPTYATTLSLAVSRMTSIVKLPAPSCIFLALILPSAGGFLSIVVALLDAPEVDEQAIRPVEKGGQIVESLPFRSSSAGLLHEPTRAMQAHSQGDHRIYARLEIERLLPKNELANFTTGAHLISTLKRGILAACVWT